MFNVLAIDDEEDLLAILEDYLNSSEIKVFTATNSEHALEVFEQVEIDVAICDIFMPGMSGLELTKLLHEKYPQTPVVILTGHGGMNEAVEALRIGVFDFVSKPFKRAFLTAAVQNAIKHRMVLKAQYGLFELLHEALGIKESVELYNFSFEDRLEYLKELTLVMTARLKGNNK